MEELLLCGGEGRLRKPSDPLAPSALDIKLFSPEPLSKLGATGGADAAPADARALKPYPELLGVLGFFAPLSDDRLFGPVFCFLLADCAALWRSE